MTGVPVHACLANDLRVVAHADYGAKFVMASEMELIVLLMALCLIFRDFQVAAMGFARGSQRGASSAAADRCLARAVGTFRSFHSLALHLP
jgi:hypothetical protein